MTVRVFAPAKVNLTLHVTGRRPDGYHLLDSLVVFAEVGDEVALTPAPDLSLRVTGPEAGGLDGEGDNLVLRAARLFDPQARGALELTKRLPVASGIGGGSADAAATLRAFAAATGGALPAPDRVAALGADVPVCLAGRPARMRGIGEDLAPMPALPAGAALVLVNPRQPVATPQVFGALTSARQAPMPSALPHLGHFAALTAFLAEMRNDLEAPARQVAPVIAEVLAALTASGAALARMSGSGATCFGLFPAPGAAQAAARRIAAGAPGWWVASCGLLPADGAGGQFTRATT